MHEMTKSYGKISLDLDDLVERNQIDSALADRLSTLKLPTQSTHYLVSVLYIIGAIAAAAGVVLLKPTATTGLILGLACLAGGKFIQFRKMEDLNILALALGIGGAAGIVGWFVLEFGETLSAIMVNGFATLVTAAIALFFRSRFLAALVPLGLGAMIGSGGAYWHAAYAIFVREPTITVVLFSAIAAVLFWLCEKHLKAGSDFAGMSVVAARMSVIITNFGFWVGSLWGDSVGQYLFVTSHLKPDELTRDEIRAAESAFRDATLFIHEHVFAVGWAAFCIGLIMIGKRISNRFVEICGIVFLAINAFTQYFEYFEDEPWALIFGGLALVGIAVVLIKRELHQFRKLNDQTA